MKTHRIPLVLSAVLGALVLVASAPAEAQYGYGYGPPPARPQFGFRHRFHPYAGAQLTGIGIIGQGTDYQTGGYLGTGGGGGGLFAGLRMGAFFALELNWNITYHQAAEDFTSWSAFQLQTVELNGKVHIPTYGPVEPYVQAGIGFAFLGASWEDEIGTVCTRSGCYYATERGDYIFASGPAFNVGGGLDWWLSPFLTFGARILYKGMRFGDPTYKSSGGQAKYTNFASAVNVDLNLALHF
jgi:opacity protein-like surface antigen